MILTIKETQRYKNIQALILIMMVPNLLPKQIYLVYLNLDMEKIRA